MRGDNYYALAIEGTDTQFKDILTNFKYNEKTADNHPDIQCGHYYIKNGILLIEIEGWGEQIYYAEYTRDYAESVGCNVFFLDVPGQCSDQEEVLTNDSEWKYFEKIGPNEHGVTFYGLQKKFWINPDKYSEKG